MKKIIGPKSPEKKEEKKIEITEKKETPKMGEDMTNDDFRAMLFK